MDLANWQQIETLYHAALEKPVSARTLFLIEACKGDEELYNEVNSLLSSFDQSNSFLKEPAFDLGLNLIAKSEYILQPGQIFKNYKILNLLGRGGMGEVFLAQDLKLNRKVALKLLAAKFTDDKDRLRRFEKEAQAISTLNHPNILTIHEVGNERGINFFVTEFVEGATLRERINNGTFSFDEILNIAIQISSALMTAHQAGIIHRDIKPENIMLRPDGYIKVLDFGLAKLNEQKISQIDNEASTLNRIETTPGLVMGTVKYMSPEQARGLEVDLRSDIFSFGIVLYEMITSHIPFEGNTPSDLIAAILKDKPLLLTQFSPNAPEELQSLINKALCKRKEDRYQNFHNILKDLKNIKEKIDRGVEIIHQAAPNSNLWLPVENKIKVAAQTSAEFTKATGDIRFSNPAHRSGYHTENYKSPKTILGLVALAIITLSVSFVLYWQFLQKNTGNSFSKIKVTKLTNTGDAILPAISADSRYVVFGKESGNKFSLWLKVIGTNSELQIVAPVEGQYFGATFSTDIKYIYFGAKLGKEPSGMYKVPILGGSTTKLALERAVQISFSPDGQKLSYLDNNSAEGKTSLIIANADGTEAKRIITRQAPDYYWTASRPAWSPDGKFIACIGQNKTESFPHIFEVNVVTGEEKPITMQKWTTMRGVEWLPDMSGLLTIASEETSSMRQLWHISYPSGEAHQVTHDTNKYFNLNLAADGESVVTTQRETPSSLFIIPVKTQGSLAEKNGGLFIDTNNTKQISISKVEGVDSVDRGRYGRIAWSPSQRIIYTSEENGNVDIWSMNADGSDRKQLTNDQHWDTAPSVSPDGRYIAFMSDRAGAESIWRMDLDGGNQIRITNKFVERNPVFSANSKWVFFNSWETAKQTIWKIPVSGGETTQVVSDLSSTPIISPDGKLIAYTSKGKINVASIDDGKPIKILDAIGDAYAFTFNGQALTYLLTRDKATNLWLQPLNGGEPRQLTNFTSDEIRIYAFSPDGKQLALARGTTTSDVIMITNLK